MYFCYFVIISPLTWVWSFIWINFYPLHPRIFCAKFGWNWPTGSRGVQGRFKNFINVFLLFVNYLPLEKKVVALHVNKLYSSSSKNALCQPSFTMVSIMAGKQTVGVQTGTQTNKNLQWVPANKLISYFCFFLLSIFVISFSSCSFSPFLHFFVKFCIWPTLLELKPLNLTKVRPLFTLLHRGSDNSPLLIMFKWTLYLHDFDQSDI